MMVMMEDNTKRKEAGWRDPCSKALWSFSGQWESCSSTSLPKGTCSCAELVLHETDVAEVSSKSFTLYFSFMMKIPAAALEHF